MAIVEAARRAGDADDRTIEHLPAVPHRTRERPPEVETEIAVAVIGEAPAEAAIVFLLLGHGHLPHANALGPRPCNASLSPSPICRSTEHRCRRGRRPRGSRVVGTGQTRRCAPAALNERGYNCALTSPLAKA